MNSMVQAHTRALVLAIQTLPVEEQVRACDLVSLALAQVAQAAASPSESWASPNHPARRNPDYNPASDPLR